MKVFDVLLAFMVLSALLLLASALKRQFDWLRQLGLPEALIAGLLGLLIGPFSPLAVLPEAIYQVWSETPGVLITLVFATLFLGQRLPSPQMLWQRAASQTCFGLTLGFGQYLVGGLVVLLVLQPLLGTNPLMACLIEIGFEGGHGTAAGMGPTLADLGLPAGEALGLAMATVGVLAAVLLGSALVVIGRTRAWLSRNTTDGLPAAAPMAEPQPLSIAREPEVATIDQLTLNLALSGAAVGLGVLLRALLIAMGGLAGPGGIRLLSAVPLFPLAMLGGLLLQLLLQRLDHSTLASAKLQGSIGSLAMDLLIAAAMASLNLPLLEENWLAFAVLAAMGLLWNLTAVLLLAPRLFRDHWFERAIADFGQGTGVTATGLLLLRMADPRGSTRVMEAFSFKQLLFEPLLGGGLVTALAPIALAAWGLQRWTAVALALTVASALLGLTIANRASRASH
jgi:ESS family glutamate:Na+ symporter